MKQKIFKTFLFLGLFFWGFFILKFKVTAIIPSEQIPPQKVVYYFGADTTNYWSCCDAGGYFQVGWKDISAANNLSDENSSNIDYSFHYNWAKIENYLLNLPEKEGKKQPAIISIDLLLINGGQYYNLTPDWLKGISGTTINLSFDNGCRASLPNYKNENYKKALKNTIYQLGYWYKNIYNGPKLEAIFIAAGVDNEVRSAKKIGECDYYQEIQKYVSDVEYHQFVKELMNWYKESFPNLPLFIQPAATIYSLRGEIIREAINKNIGIKMNSVGPGDTVNGYYGQDPRSEANCWATLGFSECFGQQVPIGFEPKIAWGIPAHAYWIITQILAHKPDVINIQKDLVPQISQVVYLKEMIEKSIGVHRPEDASLIWIGLRDLEEDSDSEGLRRWDHGEQGDWDFYLYRPEDIIDSSLELEYRNQGGNPYKFNFPQSKTEVYRGPDSQLNDPFYRQGRKILEKYLVFKADNNWPPKRDKNQGFKVAVTLKDTPGTFFLQYCNKLSCSEEELISVSQEKTGTGVFKTFVFTLFDAYFNNQIFPDVGLRENKGGDFRIEGPGEIVNRVMVEPISGGILQPPPSPEGVGFKIKAEGIEGKISSSKTLNLRFFQMGEEKYTYPSVEVINDESGVFSGFIRGVGEGVYEVLVKGWAHLVKKISNVNITSGFNILDWSNLILTAGDVNNDNKINSLDLVKILFKKGSNSPEVDINSDETVNENDFSLARRNYGTEGDDISQTTFTPEEVRIEGLEKGNPILIVEGGKGLVNPDIAYNSRNQQFLVAWKDCRGLSSVNLCSGYGRDGRGSIYGQILNREGEKIGGNFLIAQENYPSLYNFDYPLVIYNPFLNEYWVFFQAFDTQNPSCPTGNFCYNLYGQRIKSNGEKQGGLFIVSNRQDNQWVPKGEYNPISQKTLLVWHDARDRLTVEKEIYGRILNKDGSFIGDDFSLSQNADGTQEYADVTLGENGDFGVVFADKRRGDGVVDISFQLLDKDGNLKGRNIFVAQKGAKLEYPEISFSSASKNWLIAFMEDNNTEKFPLAKIISSNLESKTAIFKLDFTPSSSYSPPEVSYSSSEEDVFLTVWPRKTGAKSAIFGRLISGDGQKISSWFLLSEDNSSYKSQPKISYVPPTKKFVVIYKNGDALYLNWVKAKRL